VTSSVDRNGASASRSNACGRAAHARIALTRGAGGRSVRRIAQELGVTASRELACAKLRIFAGFICRGDGFGRKPMAWKGII